MAKYVEFPTVYGRLGNHPGTLGPEQALALFNQAMKLPAGAHLLDYWPDGGRTTVILAAAAKNLEGELTAVTNWVAAPQGAELWYQRALVTHAIKLAEANGHGADLAAVRAEVLGAIEVPQLYSRLFVYGVEPLPTVPGFKLAEQGPGWALLEKSL